MPAIGPCSSSDKHHGRWNDEPEASECEEQEHGQHGEAVHPGNRHYEQRRCHRRKARDCRGNDPRHAKAHAEPGGELRRPDEANGIHREGEAVLRGVRPKCSI